MNGFVKKIGSVSLQIIVTIIFIFSFTFTVLFAGVIYVMRRLKIVK